LQQNKTKIKLNLICGKELLASQNKKADALVVWGFSFPQKK